MNKFTLALVGALASTAAFAQTPATTTAPSTTTTPSSLVPNRPTAAPAVTTTPGAPLPAAPGVNTSTGAPTGSGLVGRNMGPAAAAGDRNQAVVTTTANAPQPARGHTSFTKGEAQRRLMKNGGYTTVSDLKKDNNGVWRGTGMKDGASVGVWLDYKGNVGQQ